jgi:hypothetical protein
MRRQSRSTNRSRRTDKRRGQLAVSVLPLEVVPTADPFQLSTCCVCGGVEDEDLIILCDGPGCNSEVHMYCLSPVMTAVPEGDWFCESCDRLGATTKLTKYFADFEQAKVALSMTSKEKYLEWLVLAQQRVVPLENWIPMADESIVNSEFDPAAEDLVGCTVRLSVTPIDNHTGRIIGRRYVVDLDRWEHFVQFKRYSESSRVDVNARYAYSFHLNMQWSGRSKRTIRSLDVLRRAPVSRRRCRSLGPVRRIPVVACARVFSVGARDRAATAPGGNPDQRVCRKARRGQRPALAFLLWGRELRLAIPQRPALCRALLPAVQRLAHLRGQGSDIAMSTVSEHLANQQVLCGIVEAKRGVRAGLCGARGAAVGTASLPASHTRPGAGQFVCTGRAGKYGSYAR